MKNNKNKTPYAVEHPATGKSPRISSDPNSYYELQPSWRIHKLEMCEPYGWHELDSDSIARVRERLAAFESMTWREILLDGKKRHHNVNIRDLCKPAQDRLTELGLDDLDRLLSLGLTGSERIWGILASGVMNLLWWDPDHRICPSRLKHT